MSCVGMGSPLTCTVHGDGSYHYLPSSLPPTAWWGLTAAEDRDHLESFLRKLRRHQFLSLSVGSFESMTEAADVRLLRAVVASESDVLRQFLPSVTQRTDNLPPRKHPFLLPPKDDRSFASRILFK